MTDAAPAQSDWPQLVFQLQSADTEELEQALFASGALSVMYHDRYDQPVLEPAPGEMRLWDDVRLIALYPRESQPEAILTSLQELLGAALPEYEWQALQDQQWERAWMRDFKPLQFASDFWVCPTHCEPPDPAAVNLRLDPGLAFGSGTHATTAQCLRWLGQQSLQGASLLDFGCGSGVLAVAAALLGAERVIAVDLDPQALAATRNNAELNQVGDRLQIGQPALAQNLEVEIVVANILYQPLMELAAVFAAALRPGGSLVLSGILDEQIESIQLRYNQWFALENSSQQENWAMLQLVRREPADRDQGDTENSR